MSINKIKDSQKFLLHSAGLSTMAKAENEEQPKDFAVKPNLTKSDGSGSI